MMKQKATPLDFKALILNTILVVLCAVPHWGWVCFLLLSVIFTVAVFRYPGTRGKFITNIVAIAAAAYAYFWAYRLGDSAKDLPEYLLAVVAVQLVVVAALALFVHFRVYKPNKEFIKAGV